MSGRVALFDATTGRRLFKATLKRAQNPHVSNEGIVTVENWKDWGGPLAGDFVAYGPDSKRLWTKKFKANNFDSGMTEDGERVFVSTCNSPHEAHGGKTFLLDTRTGAVLWSRDGFDEVKIKGNDVVIVLEGDTEGQDSLIFVLDAAGQPPPEYNATLERRELAHKRGKPWWVLPQVQAGLKEDRPDLDRLWGLLDDMDALDQQLDTNQQARALRYRGEIAEHRGDAAGAIQFWERALELNPKVGIKRKLQALKKRKS